MPFKNDEDAREYAARYRRLKMAKGRRAKEPATLEEALRELRELRKLVQQQRKRIWFLEHQEEHNEVQRRRRRAGYAQNAEAAVSKLTKIHGA